MSRRLRRAATRVLFVSLLLAAGAPARGRDSAEHKAKAKDHWAFRPVQRPSLPVVRDPSWVRTPIDAFVLAQIENKGVKPAPPADRRALLRRVYCDLIGLPPTPEEQRAFLDDRSPDAYQKVVDDLLGRPQYGERWARHWLDVVRYAETNGYERDGAKPHAWRYRDYVIDALNQDKPYDRFVTEQLAGDEIDGATAETRIATTFLRLGTWDDEPADPRVDRYDQLDDVLGTTATAFLALTLRCARCHDHKFEPFTQVDYYRMLAVFEPLKRPQDGRKDLDRPVGTDAELAAFRQAKAKADAEVAALQKKINAWNKTIGGRLIASVTAARPSNQRVGQKAGPVPTEAVAALLVNDTQRTKEQTQLMIKFGALLDQEIRKAATAEELAQRDGWDRQIAALKATRALELRRAYVWYEDGPKAPATHVLRRGDPGRPAKEVSPGLPAVLVTQDPPAVRPLATSTGRRLWLARWVASPDHPLTARVLVNRVWQHHFGKGLVASANDFGVMGERPSDPALLDWLAAEFVASGWRLKPLHRLMVLSSTYQTAAAAPADRQGLLAAGWRQRRLEAEAVRDGVLAVSGRLNPQMAGASVYPPIPRAVLEGQSRPGEGWGKSDERQASRRSIYLFVKRVLPVPELELLDAPDTTSSCEQRPVSTTAPQALTFLNGDFMQQQARAFAERLRREAGDGAAAQVRRAFELALCRPPRPEELRAAGDFLASQQRQIEEDGPRVKQPGGDPRLQALEAFCLVLLNTNEFVYLN
jgi:hypothetical protein